MGVSEEQLQRVASVLAAAAGGNPVAAIRSVLPGFAVSLCEAEDLRDETAFREVAGYGVYLVDTASHCWRIVDDPVSAGGVLIAQPARR
jgi:hypothetical protein